MSDNKESKDKELIPYIAETLRSYELPYKQGAWEQFTSKRSRSLWAIMWPYASVAALLLVVTGLYLFRTPIIPVPEGVTETAETADQSPIYPEQHAVIPESVEPVAVTVTRPAPAKARPIATALPEARSEIVVAESEIVVADVPVQEESVIETATAVTEQAPAPDIVIAENQPDRFLQMVHREQQVARQPTESPSASRHTTGKKWDIGLVLAPAANDQQLQMSGGVSFAYRLTDRLSVGSGVSIAQLGVERSSVLGGSPLSQGPQVSSSYESTTSWGKNMVRADVPLENKELESIRTQVVGLDIPLDFRFHINPRFYASAGASFFAVLNEERINNYARHVNHMLTVENSLGESSIQPVAETQHVSETTTDQPLSNSSYNGFINFSVGHRLPLFRRIGISLEPFYKLPVGRLAARDVNLSYGGMKVTAGF